MSVWTQKTAHLQESRSTFWSFDSVEWPSRCYDKRKQDSSQVWTILYTDFNFRKNEDKYKGSILYILFILIHHTENITDLWTTQENMGCFESQKHIFPRSSPKWTYRNCIWSRYCTYRRSFKAFLCYFLNWLTGCAVHKLIVLMMSHSFWLAVTTIRTHSMSKPILWSTLLTSMLPPLNSPNVM